MFLEKQTFVLMPWLEGVCHNLKI